MAAVAIFAACFDVSVCLCISETPRMDQNWTTTMQSVV